MLIAYSACQRDDSIAVSTLEWAFSLDGKLPYDCILSLAEGVAREPIIAAAEKLFRSVTILDSGAPETWPQGKNAAFQNVVRHIDRKKIKEPFFWWEPDAIPLKKGWIKAIEDEHALGGRPFTGYVHDALNSMECVAVYPHNFMEYSPINGMLCRAAPWDRCCAPEIINQVHRANHLFQFVNDIDGFPPTFTDNLSLLRPDAVLFHKNKDGTLIEQLSKGSFKRTLATLFCRAKVERGEPIVVIFPVSSKDVDQAIHHAKWLKQLGTKWPNKAVVAFDAECPSEKVTSFVTLLSDSFETVERLFYPTPPDKKYPAVANFVFARVAEYMARGTSPWLWMEADAVVLKRDWLSKIQDEYDAAGKRFMGPIIKEVGYGHANGSCVYPADTVTRIPNALKQTSIAWDYAAKSEMISDTHDASHIIAHLWGVVNGRASQTNGAVPPQNFTRESAKRLIPPSAVVMHRAKDNSLTDVLMAGGWK